LKKQVMLGLLPGWGGTQNLPALVGFKEAVPMILMGKEVRPDKAKKIGLVDVVVDPFALESVAVMATATPLAFLWRCCRRGVLFSLFPFSIPCSRSLYVSISPSIF
jgi:enoyl-CoA hydratase/carnithine racemase